MGFDTAKQEQILSTIGLRSEMLDQPVAKAIYNEHSFERYVTNNYRNSAIRESDEIYRMFEFELLHLDSGLRIIYTTSESYDGESISYKVIGLYILDIKNKKYDVVDADFNKRIFTTNEVDISFDKTSKVISL